MSNNEKDPNTLEVSVSETVGVSELSPGGASAPKPEEDEDETESEQILRKERDDALAALRERQVFLAEQYAKPHTVKSRRVKAADVPRVVEDAKLMHEMCMVGRGDYTTAHAIAHSQIDGVDPLRFFVTLEGQIFINPVLTIKGYELENVQEGCMTYPEEPLKSVMRYKKVTAKYRTLAHKVDPKTDEEVAEPYLTNEITMDFDGQMARILQHECQHLNGGDIYIDNGGASKAFNEPGSVII